MNPSAQLDATFAALADPTRRAILMQLSKGDRTVTELAKPFDMSLPAISKHLKVLEQVGSGTREHAGKMPGPLGADRSPARGLWVEQGHRMRQQLYRVHAFG